MITKRRLNYFAITLLLIVFVAACNDDDDNGYRVDNNDYSASADFAFSFYPPYQATDFILEAISGQASVQFMPDAVLDSILVWGERRVESESLADAEAHLADLHVLYTEVDNELRFRTDQPDESGGRSYIIEYHIEIPESMSLILSQVNGPVWIHDMANESIVSVVNGSIYLHGSGSATSSIVNGYLHFESFEGSVAGSSVNGGITAEIILPEEGMCDLDVVNGNISLEIPDTTSAEFSANVTNGQIGYTGLVFIDAVISQNSVAGTLGEGEGTIGLSTTNGNITVVGY